MNKNLLFVFGLLIIAGAFFYLRQHKDSHNCVPGFQPSEKLMQIIDEQSSAKNKAISESVFYRYVKSIGISSESLNKHGANGSVHLEGADFDHYSVIFINEDPDVLLGLCYKSENNRLTLVNWLFSPAPDPPLDYTRMPEYMYGYYKKAFLHK